MTDIPRNSNVTKTRTTEIWLDDDGIMYGIMVLPSTRATQDDAIADFEAYAEVSQGIPRPVLGNIQNLVSAEREARVYAAKANSKHFIKAFALVSNSKVGQIIANMFLNFQNPPYPVKFFTNNEEAIEWLKQFLD